MLDPQGVVADVQLAQELFAQFEHEELPHYMSEAIFSQLLADIRFQRFTGNEMLEQGYVVAVGVN